MESGAPDVAADDEGRAAGGRDTACEDDRFGSGSLKGFASALTQKTAGIKRLIIGRGNLCSSRTAEAQICLTSHGEYKILTRSILSL
jgi:hypothetical protein